MVLQASIDRRHDGARLCVESAFERLHSTGRRRRFAHEDRSENNPKVIPSRDRNGWTLDCTQKLHGLSR